MRVEVEGDADRGVPEAFAHDLRMDASLERECREGVAKVVKSDRGRTGHGDEASELAGEPIGMERPADLVAKDQIGGTVPGGTGSEVLLVVAWLDELATPQRCTSRDTPFADCAWSSSGRSQAVRSPQSAPSSTIS